MRISTALKLLILVISLQIWVSCSKSISQKPDQALARVGNEYLTAEQAAASIPKFLLKQDSVGMLKKYRDEWIQQQLLNQEAQRLGLADNKDVRRQLRKSRDEILRNALKKYVIESKRKKIEVTDEEARNFYQANKKQFSLDEEFVRFRHLATTTLAQARSAKQDLLSGIPWAEVAQKYGLDAESAIEESEQFWPISMALNEIDIMNRYLNVIGQNEISPIQRVNGVYHFVQLMESRAKGEMPELDWLIEKIKEWIRLNKQKQNFSSYVKNLYLKAQSNNEVETFNVITTETNQNSISEDTLESKSTNE